MRSILGRFTNYFRCKADDDDDSAEMDKPGATSTDKRLDTDLVLESLGKFGRYQMKAFISANAVSLLIAFQIMQMAFVNNKPNFYCTNGSSIAIFNETNQQKCNYNITGASYVCESDDSSYFNFDSKYGTTIVSEWNLVCSKSFYSELSSSIFMFGIMVGSGGVTQLSDMFGRRWLFMLNAWGLFVVSLSAAFVQTYSGFIVLRFLIGVLSAGMGMVAWAISCENVTTKMRSYSSMVGSMFWTTGYVLVGVCAIYVRDWRNIVLYLSLPGALTILLYWSTPETLHWYVAVGKRKESEEWIKRASKCNKKNVEIKDCLISDEKAKKLNGEKKKRSILAIFRSRVLLPQFLSMAYIWMCNAFVYYGLSLFSTNLNGDRYVNFILGGLVEVPSYVIGAFSMQKLGRRRTIVIFHLVAGISLFLLIFVPETTGNGTDLKPLIVTLSMVGKFAISLTFGAIFLFSAEIFPTTVRTVGVGWCSMAARIGSILAPYVGLLNDINPFVAPALFGVMAIVAAALSFVIAETKDEDLPEDIEDARSSKLQTMLCPCLLKS